MNFSIILTHTWARKEFHNAGGWRETGNQVSMAFKTWRLSEAGVYFSESVHFFYDYTTLLRFFHISYTWFPLNFFPNVHFGWFFHTQKARHLQKNIYPWSDGNAQYNGSEVYYRGFSRDVFHHILIPHKHRKPSIPVSFRKPSQIPVWMMSRL